MSRASLSTMNHARATLERGIGRWAGRLPLVLALILAPVAASAQVYCSRWAEVVDAPSNIRAGPSGQAPIACRLKRNGQRLLVVPMPVRASDPPPQWLATLVCRPAGQRAAIGLGRAPDYIHRSQVRLLEGNPEDWLGDASGPATGPCDALWHPYGRSGDRPASP
jgi:hypothetical protein